MDGLNDILNKVEDEGDFSFKNIFVPLTTTKAISWIIIIGIIVYGNMLFNGFVWDDKTYVIPVAMTYGLNLAKLFGHNLYNSYGYYRPITAVYFSLLFSLFGSTPFFYHFFQVILHIANTILVYKFLRTFFKEKTSLFLSLIFLVHPMQVESVSYIAQTESVLFFLFGISAFLLSVNSGIYKTKMILIYFLLLLSLLTKEVGIAFIPLILAFRYLFKKRSLFLFSAVSMLALIGYVFIRFFIEGIYFYKMTFIPISRLPFLIRLINIPEIILYYVKTFFFPFNLAISQNWVVTKMTYQTFYLPLTILLLLVSLLVGFGLFLQKSKEQFKRYLFFSLWFILGLSFYLQIFPLDSTVSDRWFYFPMVGLLGLLGVIIENIPIRKGASMTLGGLLIIFICFLSIRTIIRNNNWQNAITLYTHDSHVLDDYETESNLGWELLNQGNMDEALVHFEKSVSLLPYETNLDYVGYLYERRLDIKNARLYYIKALNIPNDADSSSIREETTYENLGRFELFYGDPIKANIYLKEGTKYYSQNVTLWILLGLDEYKLKNQKAALSAVSKAYSLVPSNNIGNLYSQIENNKNINVPIQTFYSE